MGTYFSSETTTQSNDSRVDVQSSSSLDFTSGIEEKVQEVVASEVSTSIKGPVDSSDFHRVELHVHLDGSVSPQILYEAAKRNKPHAIPSHVKNWEDFVPIVTCIGQSAHLEDLLSKMQHYMPFIIDDKTAIADMCRDFVERQYKHQVYYTETRFAPHLLCDTKMTPEEVLVLVLDTLQEASKQYNIIVKTIVCCMRHWKADKRAQETIDLAIKYRYKGVVGVDLAGSEQAATSKEYQKIFEQVKGVEGLHITIHAGEGCGPESITDAIEKMYAERIGHGYRAMEDTNVLNYLIENNIHVECCPTSSVITRAVQHIVLKDEDWSRHPMKAFCQNGVNFSISTDDPGVMATDYSQELHVCSQLIKMEQKEILQCFVNAAKAAFVDGKEKEELVQTIQSRVDKKLQQLASRDKEEDEKLN